MKKRHFQTLDALRFFAFFKVFLFHLPIAAFPVFSFLKAGGGIGVTFFFVLSGFLITYIILEEKDQTGKLNLYHFFARRILRIWPLYYFMIAFAFCTPLILSLLNLQSSDTGYKPDWFMSLTFLENYKMIFAHDQPNVSPLNVMWSLCIEEHFYIVWGLTLFLIRIEKVPVLIISAIIIANVSRYVFYINGLSFLDLLTNFDFFAFGAIPAYILVKKEKFYGWIDQLHFVYKISLIILILTYIIISPHLIMPLKDLTEPTIYGVFFSLIIFLIASGQNRFRIGDNNILSRLGIFTYGLYLFHTIIINLLGRISQKLNFSLDQLLYAIIFSVVAFFITVLVSVLSYYMFEKQFLKLKKYFY